MASESPSSARPTSYKDAVISRRLSAVHFIPLLSCAGPHRASGLRELHQGSRQLLVRAHKYDLASERSALMRPPILIRQVLATFSP
jgi:hypothetical protein